MQSNVVCTDANILVLWGARCFFTHIYFLYCYLGEDFDSYFRSGKLYMGIK